LGRHLGIVGIAEGVGVDEGEMGDVEKALHLAAREAEDVDGGADDLLELALIPMRHVGDDGRAAIMKQAGPDQPVTLDMGIGFEVEARGNIAVGMGRDMVAAPPAPKRRP
jgi:hypothetical protein